MSLSVALGILLTTIGFYNIADPYFAGACFMLAGAQWGFALAKYERPLVDRVLTLEEYTTALKDSLAQAETAGDTRIAEATRLELSKAENEAANGVKRVRISIRRSSSNRQWLR